MEGHYLIEKREHDWLVLVNGAPLMCCKSRKMAERIVRAALMKFCDGRNDSGRGLAALLSTEDRLNVAYSSVPLPRHIVDVSV